jgi:hypothetical protein
MTCNMGCTPGCWVTCILCAVGWWLIASGLLMLSWNIVVAAIANVKKVKYWHVLLIVLTLAVLCGPLWCGRHAGRGMHSGYQKYGKDCCGECGQKPKQCGGCEDWKMPADSSGHMGK